MTEEDDALNAELLGSLEAVRGRFPSAPSDLNIAQQAIWYKVIRSKPCDWFDAANLPLLREYCRVIWQLGKLNNAIDKVYDEIELDSCELKKLTGIQTQLHTHLGNLATKMRLTQQAQIDLSIAQKKAGPKLVQDDDIDGEYSVEQSGGKKPWEI